MTCPAVTLPLLANQDTPTRLQSSNQKQQCIMAPSLKEELIMTPFVINTDLSPEPAPCRKQKQSKQDVDLDDSLTSLNWLHNLKMMKIEQPTPPSSPVPFTYTSHQPENLPTYIHKEQLRRMSESCGQLDCKSVLHRTQSVQDSIDYKQNGCLKPPYSYATLIWMAMKASNKSKITLSSIYKWITENFKYYQTAEPSWQNSIRHNLSLNKCFQKVPRSKDEPGKGGFWRIDPVHAELLEHNIWKKRRALSLPEMDYTPLKRIKTESVVLPAQDQLAEDPPQEPLSVELEEEVFEIEVIQPQVELSKLSPKKRKSKSKKRKSKHSKHSKRASRKVPSLDDSSTSEDDNLPSSVLNGNFQWDSIFDSEIEVDGIKVRAEAILNPNGEVQLLPVMDSPPQSEENEDFSMFLQEGAALDLSIKGTHIPKPLWFESQTRLEDIGTEQGILNESMDDLFGATGELPPSPASSLTDQTTHPWAEAREQMEDIYFEEFLNLGDSGKCAGASGSWAPENAIQTVIIEK